MLTVSPILLAAAALVVSASAATAQTVWSQSVDNTTIVVGSVACLNNPQGITDNSWWRLYDPVQCGLTGDYEIKSAIFSVEDSNSQAGSTPITVNVRDGSAFPVVANMPILGTSAVSVSDTTVPQQTFVTAVFSPPLLVPAGTVVAIELFAPNGQPQGDFFFVGSNPFGETAPTYISAIDCGLVDPVPLGSVGFPNMHVILDLECCPAGTPPIVYICSPANPNSTGQPASLSYAGNRDLSQGPYTGVLTTTQLPPNQFGYYLASTTSQPPLPVGNGNLCLGGDIARMVGAGQPGVQNSGPSGSFMATINTAVIPTNNPPNVPILPGETWYFQAWYRDGPPSNFSDVCCIPFF
ncbi:MAG: hypothetical protein GY711_25920 [bacterium]|nr:hypothetical protein [bacterium]